MTARAIVQIIGAPVVCSTGCAKTWREVAEWAAKHLAVRFGDAVKVEYFDLFDTGCPPVPDGGKLPFVSINGEALSSGGKISLALIRKRLEESGIPIIRR